MKAIAQEQKSHKLVAETNLLQAKLKILELDLEKARELLTQAELIAKEQGLHDLERKISIEHDSLLEHENELKDVRENQTAFTELVELTQIDDSIMRMLGKRPLDIQDITIENPVMVLLLLVCDYYSIGAPD